MRLIKAPSQESQKSTNAAPAVPDEFGIKHMTIQLETECCDPDDIHCDLRKLTEQSTTKHIPSRTIIDLSVFDSASLRHFLLPQS